MEGESVKLTRAQKSALTKQTIVDTVIRLLEKYGYEYLTVRNICAEAAVSNGTFYHFFRSKEEVMVEYIWQHQHLERCVYHEGHLKEYILEIYLQVIDSFTVLGVDFNSNFFIPKNGVFNPLMNLSGTRSYEWIKDKLILAQERGEVRKDINVDTIGVDIMSIMVGNIFEWCVMDGKTDNRASLKRVLGGYLEKIFL